MDEDNKVGLVLVLLILITTLCILLLWDHYVNRPNKKSN